MVLEIMADIELTTDQAARELDIAARTVRDWLRRGKLVGRMVVGRRGNEWRISVDSVAKQAADKAAGGGAKAAVDIGGRSGGDYSLLIAEVRSLREENAQYREHLERLTIEFERLRTSIQRLLPAPREEKPPPWYKRLWQRKGGTDNGNAENQV